jgi:hypothetical protein
VDHAGEGLGEGGVFEGDVGRDKECVFFDDARRDAEVFGVGAVVEDKVFAEILLAAGAPIACVAGGRS